jgi:hypothetical protein
MERRVPHGGVAVDGRGGAVYNLAKVYMADSTIVHARLDRETGLVLKRLRRTTGLRDSALIRRGLRALDAEVAAPSPPRVVGAGKFESGVPDLGSNPEHLRGFGRK